jgi:hypothetical protein
MVHFAKSAFRYGRMRCNLVEKPIGTVGPSCTSRLDERRVERGPLTLSVETTEFQTLGMEISRLFGLPAHPLLVHVAVVLFPAVAIGLVAIALSSTLRARYRYEVLGGALLSVVMVQLTKGSGEALGESVKESTLLERHTELGGQLPVFALLVLLASIFVVGLDVYQQRIARRSVGAAAAEPAWLASARIVSTVFAFASAVLAVWWTVRVGHSGARATWPK